MTTKDLIIIGGGAAGCSAGIYAARKKLDTLLIAKDFTGQTGVSSWVENYLGMGRITGLELARKFKEHLESFDLDVGAFEEVTGLEVTDGLFRVATDEGEYLSRAVIVATGSVPKRLGAKNEEKFVGRGVSYCVTCDETAFEGKNVAVVGAGNAGLEAAIELTRFAKKVYVLEFLEESRADGVLQEEAHELSSVEIICSARVESFEGDRELEGIVYTDLISGKEAELTVDGCFVEIGSRPNVGFCDGLVDLNERGEIAVDPRTMESSRKGIYAAGDAADFADKQAIIAAGHGAVAALSAFRYLTKKKA